MQQPHGVQPVSRAADRAYEWIRDRILNGEFPSGYHLKEEHIAEEARVSRTPVREALRRLGSDYFVKFLPNQGVFVATWDEDDLEAIFDLRAMVEGYLAYRAASRITAEAIAELEQCAAQMEDPVTGHGMEHRHAHIELNRRFHSIIIEQAANSRVKAMLTWLSEIPMLLRTMERYSEADITRSNEDHRALINAFRARDAETARGVMESHLRAAQQIYIAAAPVN